MEETDITCPCYWQTINIYLEPNIGDEEITVVEDCTVCCRPIEVAYAFNDGKIKNLEYHPIEGNNF